MYKILGLVFSTCLLLIGLNAQTTDVARVLQEIEQNNKELKAFTSLMESRQFELKSGNNLADPQVETFYLPFGDHSTGDYSEFQVSQSFEFPTVYRARSNLIEAQHGQLALEYATKRQEILLKAQKYCHDLVFLNKRLRVEQLRMQQAKTIFDQAGELFEKKEVGILALNKAKIAWMQEQFKVQQIENDKRNLLFLLQTLNGGVAIEFAQAAYFNGLSMATRDSIWQDKLASDPALQALRQQEKVAMKQLRLSKNKSLPDLTAGYNYQGVAGSNFSGLYAGISIPLWHNRNKVKAAQTNLAYRQTYGGARTMVAYAGFEKQYNNYQILLDKFQEYQATLGGMNSDALLLRAYELGEISYMEYYLELQFYRQAYDSMLEMEKQLNQLKAEILKHRL